MPITFVNRQLIDNSHVAYSDFDQGCFILLLIDSKKRVSDIDLFFEIYHNANSLQNIVDAFDRLCEPTYFSWWNRWIPDAYWAA